MKLVWTEQAYQRLAAIEAYVAQDDPTAARRLIERLVQRADRLRRFPEMGRPLPEVPGSGLRELIEGRYRLVYRSTPTAVQILTVFEGHMLLPKDDLPPDSDER